jgi:hypothetical protein
VVVEADEVDEGCQVVKMFSLGLEEERSFSRHALGYNVQVGKHQSPL